ncbi:putative lipoprotein [Leptospira broomii serovar Hurstbridge str. 5399]|uniref:Lipoprotein n=1 Tax=Leptospira broomii serovar Hurstbridge str. 5399 TaxID=1049789 RepID=T0GL05_9LEPT|nr:hypothetical protein [Leptospira broomii]EQA46048.1 putative lipoprotein [Leptospira broomii serovar Hurstbridge str. 5399]
MYSNKVIISLIFFALVLSSCEPQKVLTVKLPVDMVGIWKPMNIENLRSGDTYVFSKKGTAFFFFDPAVCIKRERAIFGESLFSSYGLTIYFYKTLQLEGGDLNKITEKCNTKGFQTDINEKLIELEEGNYKIISYYDFTQKPSSSELEDFVTFKIAGKEFYKFSRFPEHFQEVIDYEITDERRLYTKQGDIYVRTNGKRPARVVFE